MARPTKIDITALSEQAYRAFLASGYRRTQVSDVAARLGVSVGALYRHVESKEALFELALRWAFSLPIATNVRPIAALPLANLTAEIGAHLAQEIGWSTLEQALAAPPPPDLGAVEEELRAILSGYYRTIQRLRFGIKILDRCFTEIPEIRDTHILYLKGKGAEFLTRYIALRADQGLFQIAGTAAMTARAMMEMIVWMAMHRKFDPLPPASQSPEADDDDDDALASALALACHGVVRHE